MDELPDQEELRRRLRAARALRGLHVTDVAALMPDSAKLSLSTLRKIEAGERKLDATVLRELAARIGVPYVWFTVPDVGQAVAGAGGETFEDRLAALEVAQAQLVTELRAGPRGGARRVPPKAPPGRSA